MLLNGRFVAHHGGCALWTSPSRSYTCIWSWIFNIEVLSLIIYLKSIRYQILILSLKCQVLWIQGSLCSQFTLASTISLRSPYGAILSGPSFGSLLALYMLDEWIEPCIAFKSLSPLWLLYAFDPPRAEHSLSIIPVSKCWDIKPLTNLGRFDGLFHRYARAHLLSEVGVKWLLFSLSELIFELWLPKNCFFYKVLATVSWLGCCCVVKNFRVVWL